jgi:type I restriction enzyme S subunit
VRANVSERGFAVWFAEMERWSPGSFVEREWKWPPQYIRPLSDVLEKRQIEVDRQSEKFALMQLATLRFDGSMEPRDTTPSEIKGKLYLAKSGDVVFSKIDVRNGAIGIVPKTIPLAAFTSEFPIYCIRENIALAEYVTLLFRTAFFRRTINAMISGASGRKRVQPTQLMDVEIPLPPLDTQRIIVQKWRDARAVAEEALAFAERIEKDAAQEFLHGLGLVAPGEAKPRKAFALRWDKMNRWGVAVNQPTAGLDVADSRYPVRTLGELIAYLENGWSPKCFDRPACADEWGVLKVGAVSFGIFDENQNKTLPPSLKPIPRYEVKPGDLLISRANIARLVGACALVKKTRPKLMLCDKIFRVIWRPESELIPEYLDEVLKIPHLRNQIENALTGTSPTMKNISKPSLLALRMPVPPPEVQQTLVKAIGEARQKAAAAREKAETLKTRAAAEIEAAILGGEAPGADRLDAA